MKNPIEVGAFLRKRRESLHASDAGFDTERRRRTPGLRREEVALLANISVQWYTLLEQGKVAGVSPQTLNGISKALQLNDDERRHIFELVGLVDTWLKNQTELPREAIAIIKRIPDACYVIDRKWDIVAWNDQAVYLYEDFGRLPMNERNILRFLLLNPRQRRRLPEWETEAQNTVALFKASTVAYRNQDWYKTLINDLKRECPQFGEWWKTSKVLFAHDRVKQLRHPELGDLQVKTTILQLQATNDFQIHIQTY